MHRRACIAVVGWALTCVPACERSRGVSDQDLGGLVVADHAAPAGIDVGRAALDPDELGRALARPFATELAALGPHQVTTTTHTTVTEHGTPVSDLADSATLEVGSTADRDGVVSPWHGVYTNSADYGRETTWVGGQLYLRPRYQHWHERAAEAPDEPARLRDGYADAVAATWELLAPGVELTDAGSAQVAGRTGRRIVVRLAAAPRPPPREPLAQRGWRERRTIDAVDGEVVLDAETGVPIAVKLTGAIGFQRDGRTFAMKLEATRTVAIGARTIAVPAASDVVATPERAREVDDRDFLLQGIAPPLRKTADAAAGSGIATGSNKDGKK